MILSLSNFIRRACSHNVMKEFEEMGYRLCKLPEGQQDIKKSITFALIGQANVGKSTLINSIMGMNICPASVKPQTTMQYQRVFHLSDATEIVLLDTPGIVSARNKKKYKIKDEADVFTMKELKEVDIVGVIADASDKYSKSVLSTSVKQLISTFPSKMELILILNKVDKVHIKSTLLKYIDKVCNDLKSSDDANLNRRLFSRIFMISALQNDGVEELVNYVRSIAKLKSNHKSSGRLSDHPDQKIVAGTVRAVLLEHFQYNIPYVCHCEVDYLEENVLGKINTIVTIICPNEGIQRIVGNNSNIEKISVLCENYLEKIFRKPVLLKLHVIVTNKTKTR